MMEIQQCEVVVLNSRYRSNNLIWLWGWGRDNHSSTTVRSLPQSSQLISESRDGSFWKFGSVDAERQKKMERVRFRTERTKRDLEKLNSPASQTSFHRLAEDWRERMKIREIRSVKAGGNH